MQQTVRECYEDHVNRESNMGSRLSLNFSWHASVRRRNNLQAFYELSNRFRVAFERKSLLITNRNLFIVVLPRFGGGVVSF
jgi:hypothetical protein